MPSNKAIILLWCLVTLFEWSHEAEPFCQPLNPNIDPSNLPKLPQEFETRIELNFLNENRSEELFVKFDYYDKKGEIIRIARDQTSRKIFFFDKNELFYLEGNKCNATKLNESSQNIFFGLTWDGNTYNMQQSNYFFHFNNGNPTVKLDDTKWRDIPASHYQSCQNWQEVNANVLIDYYFSKPSHAYPTNYDPSFKELPISIMIEGIINMNQPQETKIKIEYNFFEFRTAIERKFDLFTLPEGVFCDGQSYKDEIPKIPDTFSFTEDIISQQFNYEKSSNVHYSKPLKAVRFDFEGNKIIAPWFIEGTYKAIHDFNSGVGYAINEDNKNCLIYPIGTYSIDRNDIFPIEQGNQALIQIKEPNQLFYLDDSYFYAGQRYERDILCDVFISKRTDIPIQNMTGIPVIVEFFFQNVIANIDQGLDHLEEVVPVSVHVTIENLRMKLINQIFNFDSEPYNRRFDISDCFYGKDKALFKMRFKIPDDLDRSQFIRYERPILEQFEETVKKSLKGLEFSPLRIISPRISIENRTFIISSGVTATAEAINHFRQVKDSKIDQSKAKYKYSVDSQLKCASVCLDKNEIKTLTGNQDFTCRSFDFCKDSSSSGYFCNFYDSTISDPDITLETAPACEHYSKSTIDFDIATVDQMYGSIKEAILRKEFKFDIETRERRIYTFEPEDIFDQNQGQNVGSAGSTSYFSRFDLLVTDTDFQEDFISSNPTILLRKKSFVSIDECSRLCILEPTFSCQSLTYNDVTKECKWASLLLITDNITVALESIKPENGSTIFIRDPLYDYIEYPFKVTALVDYSLSNVVNPSECAFKCNTEKKCRSFNLCKKDDQTFRCLLSDTNVHNTEKDPNVVYSAICSHYSIRAINDFEVIVQTQLSVQAQSMVSNQSVEGCAEICSFQDGYLCRSFDYNIQTKECSLYQENVKDKNFKDLGIKSNPNVNHYSRLYYQKDGKLMQIEPLAPGKKNEFSGGIIFGVTLAVIICGLIIGGLIGLAYVKFSKKTSLLPVMKFTNPNYDN